MIVRIDTNSPMKLSEIQERDQSAVARLGRPETDPLLRAEMDRRLLVITLEAVLALTDDMLQQSDGAIAPVTGLGRVFRSLIAEHLDLEN